MNKCPPCQREAQQVKIGFNRSGSQRYWCKGCGHKYTAQPSEHGYREGIRQEALRLYVDGVKQRRIGRILKVSHQSVANWIKAGADELAEHPPSPQGELEVNELDELFTFVGSKKTKSTSSPA